MDATTPSPLGPASITKSNSVGSRSTKSYDSIRVLGSYMVGTLHLIRHDTPPPCSVGVSTKLPPPRLVRQPHWPSNVMTHPHGGGDVVLVMEVPEAYTVGYDSLAFSAKKFIGLRDMPAGPHFFWAAHPESRSSRSGFWIWTSSINRLHVIKWDKDNEVFVQPNESETRTQAEALESIHPRLPLYRDPTATHRSDGHLDPGRIRANRCMWRHLTGSVNQPVLDRVMADQEGSFNVHTGDSVDGALIPAAERELERALRHPFGSTHELKFCFRAQDSTWTPQSTGRDRTVDAMDTTNYVVNCMDAPRGVYSDLNMVGEFQLTYVMGMYLGNHACIQQWWHVCLNVFLKAYRLPWCRPRLVAIWLNALRAQLRHSIRWLEGSILDSSEVNTRNLRTALSIYKRRLEETLWAGAKGMTPLHGEVTRAFGKLEDLVGAELRWDLGRRFFRRKPISVIDGDDIEYDLTIDFDAEEERDEWAPQVVRLDKEGRQVGLVSMTD